MLRAYSLLCDQGSLLQIVKEVHLVLGKKLGPAAFKISALIPKHSLHSLKV